jgi:hypothetical protein
VDHDLTTIKVVRSADTPTLIDPFRHQPRDGSRGDRARETDTVLTPGAARGILVILMSTTRPAFIIIE